LSDRFVDSPEFKRLLEDAGDICLLRVALEIARDTYQGLGLEPYLQYVEELADRVRARCASHAGSRKVLKQINWVLYTEEGYRGNREDYFDPRNSYINEVIDRRIGIPISLSLLYQAIAKRVGIVLQGLNLPAHYMLRVEEGDELIVVDPFHDGEILDRHGCERRLSQIAQRSFILGEEYFAACRPRVTIARMLRNLKSIYLGTHDFISALPVQRRLTALIPDDPGEQRDLGMTCMYVDRHGEAIALLSAYLESCPDAEDGTSVRSLLAVATRVVAQWN
jgi:regulator of sirC expression with transglutaminase-like and TPR domain